MDTALFDSLISPGSNSGCLRLCNYKNGNFFEWDQKLKLYLLAYNYTFIKISKDWPRAIASVSDLHLWHVEVPIHASLQLTFQTETSEKWSQASQKWRAFEPLCKHQQIVLQYLQLPSCCTAEPNPMRLTLVCGILRETLKNPCGGMVPKSQIYLLFEQTFCPLIDGLFIETLPYKFNGNVEYPLPLPSPLIKSIKNY